MNFHELDSVITRIGRNCRIIFSGDTRQSDLVYSNERSGLRHFMEIVTRMGSFAHVEFDRNDIVRSGLVREYIIEKFEYEFETKNLLN